MLSVSIDSGPVRLMTPDELEEYLKKFPRCRAHVSSVCEHKETYVRGGIRYCAQCGESLEVTSFRD